MLIRKNIFETNSSSTHTLSLKYNEEIENYLENLSNLIDSNGDIWFDCNNFNLDTDLHCESLTIFSSAKEKISFLATLWNSYNEEVRDIYTIDDLIYFIKKNTLCNNVYIYGMGNIELEISSRYKFDFLPTDKDLLYELLFSSNKEIFVEYESDL